MIYDIDENNQKFKFLEKEENLDNSEIKQSDGDIFANFCWFVIFDNPLSSFRHTRSSIFKLTGKN